MCLRRPLGANRHVDLPGTLFVFILRMTGRDFAFLTYSRFVFASVFTESWALSLVLGRFRPAVVSWILHPWCQKKQVEKSNSKNKIVHIAQKWLTLYYSLSKKNILRHPGRFYLRAWSRAVGLVVYLEGAAWSDEAADNSSLYVPPGRKKK